MGKKVPVGLIRRMSWFWGEIEQSFLNSSWLFVKIRFALKVPLECLMYLWLQLTGRHPKIQNEQKSPAEVRELAVVSRRQPFCIFSQGLFLSPLPICSFSKEGLDWTGEWGHFFRRELQRVYEEENLPFLVRQTSSLYPSMSGPFISVSFLTPLCLLGF